MPWMVFYQQSSVIEKGLKKEQLGSARLDTAFGSVVTQLVMAAVLVAAASALAGKGNSKSLESIGQVAGALTHTLGPIAGNLCFGLGVLGASFVASVVVTLTAARTLGELSGFKHSLDRSPSQAPWFYSIYIVVLLAAAGIVLAGANLVTLSVGVQVMNAMLLPIVLGFLFLYNNLHAAHHVVAGRPDLHRLGRDVDVRELLELVVHRRQPASDELRVAARGDVEEDAAVR